MIIVQLRYSWFLAYVGSGWRSRFFPFINMFDCLIAWQCLAYLQVMSERLPEDVYIGLNHGNYTQKECLKSIRCSDLHRDNAALVVSPGMQIRALLEVFLWGNGNVLCIVILLKFSGHKIQPVCLLLWLALHGAFSIMRMHVIFMSVAFHICTPLTCVNTAFKFDKMSSMHSIACDELFNDCLPKILQLVV